MLVVNSVSFYLKISTSSKFLKEFCWVYNSRFTAILSQHFGNTIVLSSSYKCCCWEVCCQTEWCDLFSQTAFYLYRCSAVLLLTTSKFFLFGVNPYICGFMPFISSGKFSSNIYLYSILFNVSIDQDKIFLDLIFITAICLTLSFIAPFSLSLFFILYNFFSSIF